MTGAQPRGRLAAVEGFALDGLVNRLLEMSAFDYRVASDDRERETAYRLRGSTVVDRGWVRANDLPDGQERDKYDDRAIQVVGYDDGAAICTGRVVLPPGLPTEDACGIVVEPRGQVVDVGRMCVAASHQSREHAAFIGLMCRLYSEMRESGYEVACGMMSAPARTLVRHFGLRLELLGAERRYWNEARTPVRFNLLSNADIGEPLDEARSHPEASTNDVLAPPKPNELERA